MTRANLRIGGEFVKTNNNTNTPTKVFYPK